MAKHVKELITTIFPKPESWKLVLLQEWDTIIGDLKVQVKLEKIQTDTLILTVSNTSWMQELYCLSDILIKKVNSKLDYPHIKKLRFKCLPSIKNKTLNAIMIKKSTKTHEIVLTSTQKKALDNIQDPHLKHALRNFLVRCYYMNE